jgi:membrane-bound lytic murein transglycosylase B
MPAKRTGRIQKATTIVPLALLSAAWTASLTQGAAPTASVAATTSSPEGSLPGGASVPTQAIEAPASISAPDEVSPGFEGSQAEIDQIVSTSSTNGIPAAALAAYQRAEAVINSADKSCNLTWQLVAAIGRVESDHGRFGGNALDSDGVAQPGIYGIALDGTRNTAVIRDTDAGAFDNDTTYDRAVGPMQFIPSTWSAVGVDADGDGVRNPQDIDDAALGSAVYLCSGTDDLSTLSGQRDAVFRYNRSDAYVDLVLSIADNYLEGDFMSVPNGTTAAGFLTPLPGFTPNGPRDSGPEPAPAREPDAEPAPAPEAPTEPEPQPEPQPQPQPTRNPDDNQDDGPKLPLPSLPPIDLPDLPDTEIEPVDEVLTLAQAIVQCTLDGLIDNPLTLTDRFDTCVEDYRTPDGKN